MKISILLVFACVVLCMDITQAWKLSRGSQPPTLKSQPLKSLTIGLMVAIGTAGVLPVKAQDQFRLPPIDRSDKDRCVMVSSAMGQANAARQKLFDLRECDLRDQNAKLKDLSGVIGSNADFRGVSFVEGQLSKGYLRNSNFVGADFTNGVVDRDTFDGSDLKGAILRMQCFLVLFNLLVPIWKIQTSQMPTLVRSTSRIFAQIPLSRAPTLRPRRTLVSPLAVRLG